MNIEGWRMLSSQVQKMKLTAESIIFQILQIETCTYSNLSIHEDLKVNSFIKHPYSSVENFVTVQKFVLIAPLYIEI